MTTMELTLSLGLVLLMFLIARLLLAAARRKKQLARFQQLIDLEAEQEKVKAITAELRRKHEGMRAVSPRHAFGWQTASPL